MALDEKNRRVFVGCRQPTRLLALDMDSGKTLAGVNCAGDTDDLFYDAANRRVYVSGGEGVISVIEQASADQYRVVESIRTAPGARTSFFVHTTAMLYLAVPHKGGQAAELGIFQTPRANR
jgi:hypothetical protein